MQTLADILAQAVEARSAGRPDAAERLYRRAIQVDPTDPTAYADLASLLGQQNRVDEAIEYLREVARLRPSAAEVHFQLGLALAFAGRRDEARHALQRATTLRGDFAEAHYHLARILAAEKNFNAAAESLHRALTLKPDFAEAHEQLGAVLAEKGRLDEALRYFAEVVRLTPLRPESHNNLAVTLSKLNRNDEAIAACRQALALNPDYADANYNLALLCAREGHVDEAIGGYRRTLSLRPERVEAWRGLATVLERQGRTDEARQCYEAIRPRVSPNELVQLSMVGLCPHVFQSTSEILQFRSDLTRRLDQIAARDPNFDVDSLSEWDSTPSFGLAFHGLDDRPIREAYAKIFRGNFTRHAVSKRLAARSGERMRIGFVVTERHELGFLRSLGGVIQRMDPERFELTVVCGASGAAALAGVLPSVAVLSLPDKLSAMAETIRAAQFDLLYYWEVGTDNTNYFLPFFRLARVQVTSWGIQVTSGIDQLDYYLSSRLAETPDAQSHYTEKLVLADTLLTWQQRRATPEGPHGRAFFGFDSQQHLYVCAQRLAKFHPDFDPIVADILHRDERAVVVWTGEQHGQFLVEQLRARLARTMSDVADRVLILPYQPQAAYLSLVAAADVLLDPPHFGGVNSTYDGFSLAKPIVTLPSEFQRGRYTLACYQKMGVTDCIASSPEHYADIAIRLGTQADYRAHIADRIRHASDELFEDAAAVTEHERIFSEVIGDR
jgi:protein O-GlcNAc transferase